MKYSNEEYHFPVPVTYVVHPHQSFPTYRQGETTSEIAKERSSWIVVRVELLHVTCLKVPDQTKNVGGYDKNLEVASGANKYHFPTLMGQS